VQIATGALNCFAREDSPANFHLPVGRAVLNGYAIARSQLIQPQSKKSYAAQAKRLGEVTLADKRLYTIFRTGGNGFTGQAWCSDDGKTWTKPTSLPCRGVALRERRLSKVLLACTTGRPGPVVVMLSVDGSAGNWSQISPILNGKSTNCMHFIEAESGKLLVVYDSVPYGWHEIPY